MWWAAQGRASVTVAWDGPPGCSGTEVRDGPTGRHVADIRPDLRCTLPVTVTNHGSRSVDIEEVRLPGLGPDMGLPVRAAEPEGRPTELEQPFARDAVFPVSHKLEAGASYQFDVSYEFNPDTCHERGSRVGLPGIPTVTVSAVGLSGTRTVRRNLWFRGTAAECSLDDPTDH